MPVSRSTAQIARSLASVLAQSIDDIEVLVYDDAGHGRSAVERTSDGRVDYRHNVPPLGFVGNHEALLARARGDLIAFLHDDDEWAPTYLETAVRQLEHSPVAGLALIAHRELPGGAIAPHPPAGTYVNALPLLLGDHVRLLPSATVLRRAIVADVRRPWPSLSCGDMVLYLDAAAAGWGVTVIEDALVSYARHPGQISADDIRFREDLAELFELYRFDDPEAERLRRHRVAISRLSIARAQLRAGRPADVQTNVSLARGAERTMRTHLEGKALVALCRRPRLLRVVLGSWYAIRGVPPTTSTTETR
jgi:glycosyltransferase involved in cell wall biosynthesis